MSAGCAVIRRSFTRALMALAFWGAMKFDRMQVRDACRAAGGRMATEIPCEGGNP